MDVGKSIHGGKADVFHWVPKQAEASFRDAMNHAFLISGIHSEIPKWESWGHLGIYIHNCGFARFPNNKAQMGVSCAFGSSPIGDYFSQILPWALSLWCHSLNFHCFGVFFIIVGWIQKGHVMNIELETILNQKSLACSAWNILYNFILLKHKLTKCCKGNKKKYEITVQSCHYTQHTIPGILTMGIRRSTSALNIEWWDLCQWSIWF